MHLAFSKAAGVMAESDCIFMWVQGHNPKFACVVGASTATVRKRGRATLRTDLSR